MILNGIYLMVIKITGGKYMESANPKRWNRLRVEYDNIGFFSWLEKDTQRCFVFRIGLDVF